jgi:hypothetical protein
VRNEDRLQGKGETTWPAYFHIGRVDRWWEDLDAYRKLVLDQVRLGCNRMEAPMRAAIVEVWEGVPPSGSSGSMPSGTQTTRWTVR